MYVARKAIKCASSPAHSSHALVAILGPQESVKKYISEVAMRVDEWGCKHPYPQALGHRESMAPAV